MSYQYGLATVLSLTWESPYLGKTVIILKQGPGFYFCSLFQANRVGAVPNVWAARPTWLPATGTRQLGCLEPGGE